MRKTGAPDLVAFKQDIEVRRSSFDSFQEHMHEFYEFEYIVEGNGYYVINGETVPLSKGNLVFVSPTDLHGYRKGDARFSTITVKFTTERLPLILRNISKLDSFIINCDKALEDAFFTICEESKAQHYREFAILNCLERILILVLRNSTTTNINEKIYSVENIIGYINRNFRNNLTLAEVAEKCCCAQAHFCRQFKKSTGKTFVEYLNGVRCSHAKNLLITTDMAVTDIAYECGFGSVRSFNREFLKKFGCPPLEYRKTVESI